MFFKNLKAIIVMNKTAADEMIVVDISG